MCVHVYHLLQYQMTYLNCNTLHRHARSSLKIQFWVTNQVFLGVMLSMGIQLLTHWRTVGPSESHSQAVLENHTQQHSVTNLKTCIFSDTVVRTSKPRMFSECGWKPVWDHHCVAVCMQVWMERSAVWWTCWDQSGCFLRTIVPQSQTNQQQWDTHWSDCSNCGCYRHLAVCPPHSWHVYVPIPGGWDPQIPVLLWNPDNVVQWSAIPCQ